MSNPMAIKFAGADDVDLARNDEPKLVPVFNYSRAFVTPTIAETVLTLIKNAAARRGTPVGGQIPEWVEGENGEVLPRNRLGTTTEVAEYYTRISSFPRRIRIPSLSRRLHNMRTLGDPLRMGTSNLETSSGRLPPGSWVAVGNHWRCGAGYLHGPSHRVGMSGVIVRDIRCGGNPIIFPLFASSILAHMSQSLPGQVPTHSPPRAVVCRWLGKCVAIASAIGILLVCFFHVTGMFNDCFCNSTTFDKRGHWVVFKGINDTLDPGLVKSRISGLVMAFFSSILFGFSMYMGLPPRRHD